MERERQQSFYRRYIKRSFDFIFALIGLIVTFPFLLITFIFIKLDTPGPLLFVQERIGYGLQRFKIYKLRTMDTREFDEDGNKIRDRNRVTRSGKIIRKLSLDEIPQFFNILKGDMSFIGPRPLVVRYLPYYTEEELRRHDVLPGITGLAQVNGRGYLQWEDRFKYDLEYVDNVSLSLDVKILFLSIYTVIKKEGTSTIRPADLVDFDIHRQNEKNIVGKV